LITNRWLLRALWGRAIRDRIVHYSGHEAAATRLESWSESWAMNSLNSEKLDPARGPIGAGKRSGCFGFRQRRSMCGRLLMQPTTELADPMFKFLLSVVWGVAKIILMTTVVLVVLVGLAVIWGMADDYLRYSIFSCLDKNLTLSDSDTIPRIKKYIETELLGDSSYKNVYVSSDYNKISRGLGTDYELGGCGWSVSRKDASYPFQVDVINTEFIGSNSSYVNCYMLACGRILGCEAH
jgi:hypothetical protein